MKWSEVKLSLVLYELKAEKWTEVKLSLVLYELYKAEKWTEVKLSLVLYELYKAEKWTEVKLSLVVINCVSVNSSIALLIKLQEHPQGNNDTQRWLQPSPAGTLPLLFSRPPRPPFFSVYPSPPPAQLQVEGEEVTDRCAPNTSPNIHHVHTHTLTLIHPTFH